MYIVNIKNILIKNRIIAARWYSIYSCEWSATRM